MDSSGTLLPHGLQPGPLCHGAGVLNLRELLEAIRIVPDAVLEHHMMRCALEDHFELYEFPNDLARWCWTALGDNVLGEQLGLVDPYRQPDHGGPARDAGQRDRGPAVGPGSRALVPPRPGTAPDRVAPDRLRHGRADRHAGGPAGGHRAHVAAVAVLPRPRGAAADGGASRRFLALAGEVRRRRRRWWRPLRAIDFYFLNLSQLRQALVEAFRHYLAEAPAVPRTAP